MPRLSFPRNTAMVSAVSTLMLVCLCSCGCELAGNPSDSDGLTIVTYNVQNLFDTLVSGSEYPEYTPEQGWSAQAYARRLEQTGRAITQGHVCVPDILALQEIEHVGVLEDLLGGPLKSRGYQWYAVTADSGSAIQTAVASRFPIIEARVHRGASTRSALEVKIDVGSEQIVLFALHAKSRREGVEETEALRIDLANLINDRVKELVKENPLLPVVIAGDFNESADSYFREDEGFQTALVPVQAADSQAYKRLGSFIVGGSTPTEGGWYTWWLDSSQTLMNTVEGSYWYGGVWESFDQILLSPAFFDSYGLEFSRGYVGMNSQLLDDDGHPDRWNVQKKSGISDHLPVAVTLSGR